MFNPNEFPDVPSGSVSERLVGLGYESFIRIDSTTLLTDTDTRRYSPESVPTTPLKQCQTKLYLFLGQSTDVFPMYVLFYSMIVHLLNKIYFRTRCCRPKFTLGRGAAALELNDFDSSARRFMIIKFSSFIRWG